MQILLMAIILSFIILSFILIFKKKSDGFFSPVIIALGFIFLTNVPYMISLASDYNLLYSQIQAIIPRHELSIAIFKYSSVLVLGILGLILGLRTRVSKKIGNSMPVFVGNESRNRYRLAFIFTFALGLLGYIMFFNSAGGLSNWLSNLSLRASFTTGNGYLTSLMGLSQIAVYIYICSFKYKNTRVKFLTLVILVLIVSLLSSSLGGRKETLSFVVFCFLVWNFAIERINRIPMKAWLLIPLVLLYIIAVPILRTENGMEIFTNDPSMLIEEVKDDFNTTTKQFSYIDHQLLIMSHFKLENLWLGQSYKDLLYAPIPSSIYNDKPPIDDGAYIRTIAEGVPVSPQTPYNRLFQSSWPPETFGSMYMNFSVLGVFLGMYLLGIIYSASFVYMSKSNYSLFSILVYGNIILNFQLSNLRIVQTVSEILIIFLGIGIFFSGKRNKKVNITKKA